MKVYLLEPDHQTANSYYQASKSYQLDSPALDGHQQADVVVIGVEITGASAHEYAIDKAVGPETAREYGITRW